MFFKNFYLSENFRAKFNWRYISYAAIPAEVERFSERMFALGWGIFILNSRSSSCKKSGAPRSSEPKTRASPS